MKILHNQDDHGILTMLLQGETLDARESSFFKQKTMDIIETTQCQNVIIDMGQLNFIDSSGLDSLLSLQRTLNSKGGNLKICSMTKPIRTVFELVCMHKIFDIHETHQQALFSIKNNFLFDRNVTTK